MATVKKPTALPVSFEQFKKNPVAAVAFCMLAAVSYLYLDLKSGYKDQIENLNKKLDLYDDGAKKIYQYKLDIQERNGEMFYVFAITPEEDLGLLKKDRVVVDEMITWFNLKTLEVMYRTYVLSYKAGVYDFDVSMEVEMTKYNNLLVPKLLRYRVNWDVIFKKRERALFTATLFDFK